MTTDTDRHRVTAVHEAAATVVRVDRIADDVVALSLALPRMAEWPWQPGDHIDVEIPDGDFRQYSLCGDTSTPSTLTIAVLREPQSRGGSAYLHSLTIGDAVRIRGPRSNFPLQRASSYRFIAGGIGITPILSMIRHAEKAKLPWSLLYGGRRRSSMAFLEELGQFGDRVSLVPQDELGLPDIASWLGDPDPNALVYCCGPNGLLEAVEKLCATWPPRTLRTEHFAPREVGAPVLAEPFEVELSRTGICLRVEPGTSILEAIARAGVPTLSACNEGTCGTCETPVLQGIPEHRDSVLDEEDRAANEYMMICVSRSVTPKLVLDL